MNKLAALPLLLALTATAYSQELFKDQFAVEYPDGTLAGHLYNVKGGQQQVQANGKAGGGGIESMINLFGSNALWFDLTNSLNGKGGNNIYAIYSTQKGARLSNAVVVKKVTVRGWNPKLVVFPACDLESNAVGAVKIRAQGDGPYDTDAASTTRPLGQKAKAWMVNNFTISVANGSIPALRSEAIALRAKEDTNLRVVGYETLPFEFVIHNTEAQPYRDLYRATLQGTPKEVPIRVQYQDHDGAPLLTIEMRMIVVGIGHESLWDDPDNAGLVRVRWQSSGIGHTIVIKNVEPAPKP